MRLSLQALRVSVVSKPSCAQPLVKEAWVDNNRHSKHLISNTYLAIPALLSSSPDNKLPDSASAMVGLV